MKFKSLIMPIKKIILFFVIVLTFTLSSCEKDLYDDSIQSNARSVTMKNFSVKDLKSDKSALRNKIEDVKQRSFKRDQSNKIVYDSINNFYFDDENGIFIDDGVKHSYVFTIYKNIDEDIEKLVFSSNPDGTYKTLIAKYDFSAQELATLSKQELEQKPVEFEEIAENGERGVFVTCIHYVISVDDGENHGADSPAVYEWVDVSVDCVFASPSSGGSVGGNAGNYGGFGNTSNPGGSGALYGSGSNPNTTTGVYGNGGLDGTGIYSTPITPKKTAKEIKIAFTVFLNDPTNPHLNELGWWNNPANASIVAEIVDYMTINQTYGIEDQTPSEFALELINQMVQNPELVLDINASIKSPANIDRSTITDATPEGKKFNDIYNELLKSPEFKELFIDLFQDSDRLNVKFEMPEHVYSSTNPTQEINGKTIKNGNVFTIQINKQLFNLGNPSMKRTQLEIEKTILHECVHAYLFAKGIDINAGISIPLLQQKDLEECIDYIYDTTGDQHDFIYTHLVPTMQNILSQSLNTLTSQPKRLNCEQLVIYPNIITNLTNTAVWNWDTYFYYLALQGLNECQTFQTDFPSNSDAAGIYNQYSNHGHLELDYILP